jgi:hypothetical protein
MVACNTYVLVEFLCLKMMFGGIFFVLTHTSSRITKFRNAKRWQKNHVDFLWPELYPSAVFNF